MCVALFKVVIVELKIFSSSFNYMQEVKLGIYQHFKGKKYQVLGVARHSETLEELVVYQALYDSPEFGSNSLWARPEKMFFDKVNYQGKIVSRFDYLK